MFTTTPTRLIGPSAVLLAVALLAAPAFAADRRQRPNRARRHESGGHKRQRQDHGSRPRKKRPKNRDGVSVSFNFGHPGHYAKRYYPGHPRGYYAKRWVPPVYETRYRPCGQSYIVLVRPGYYEEYWVPYRTHRRRPHTYRRHHSRGHHSGIRVSGHFNF